MRVDIKDLLKKDFRLYENKDYTFTKINDKYEPITFGDFLRRTDRFVKFLLEEGYKGKRIMVYGENSVSWMVADLAIVGFVGASIGAPAAWKTDDVDNEIGHLDIACVFYSESKKEYIDSVKAHYPDVKFYPLEMTTDGTLELDESLNADTLFEFESRDYEDCAKVVFSSGTTSFPKAVMLSLKNIFAGIESTYRRCPFTENEVAYTFVPFSHTYGGIYNFYYSLYYGFQIYLTSRISNIVTEIREVNPTAFCAVPLILNRMLEGYGEDKIKYAFGNRIRYLFVGGAEFSRDVKRIYKEQGLNLIEAYALSETGSSFAFEYSDDPAIMSTGTVFEDLEVEVRNPDEKGYGEVCCKGDAVFLGYMNEPGVTAEVLSDDGWFKTGDIGYVDEEGHLYITGRSKKLLLGPNGENINDEKIRKQIREAVPDVSDIKIFLKDNELTCFIYVPNDELKELDWNNILADINARNAKYDNVRAFKVFKDNLENRLKQ